MALPSGLTQAETNEFLHDRLLACEQMLSGLYPKSAAADLETLAGMEVDTASIGAAVKAKIKTALAEIKTKVKSK